jgi:uncharacterized protein (TIGR02246 family)
MASDEQQIRQLVATWMAATKSGDVDTVLGLMADDVVFLVPGREPMRKSEFAAAARAQASGAAPKFDGTSEIQEIQVAGDWASMWTRLRVVATPPDGSPPSERAGHTLTVLRKHAGRWLLARDANLLAPVQASTSPRRSHEPTCCPSAGQHDAAVPGDRGPGPPARLVPAAAAGAGARQPQRQLVAAGRDGGSVAASLQRDGLAPRSSVAICAANSLEYVAVFLGALRAGVAVAPLATQSSAQQLASMAADSGARHFFVDAAVPAFDTAARRIFLDGSASPSLQEWLAPEGARPQPVAVQPDWPFNIIYSSGTTGTPKGIVQPHGMRWGHVARADSYGYGPKSVTVIATSLCSNTTLVCAFPTLAKGGCLVLAGPSSTPRPTWRWPNACAPRTRCWCRCSTSA